MMTFNKNWGSESKGGHAPEFVAFSLGKAVSVKIWEEKLLRNRFQTSHHLPYFDSTPIKVCNFFYYYVMAINIEGLPVFLVIVENAYVAVHHGEER